MPTSKKSRKKTPSKKKSPDNVVDYVPNPREMEATIASSSGSHNTDSLDQAQELIYDASRCADKKQRIAIAKKALKISPLCADAYNLLADESAESVDEALALYRRAVDAGKEALGPGEFVGLAGEFWRFLETRPYMRARAGLGEALWATGDREGAIENFKEMLELNPDDNQGIRYVLAAKLLDMGKLDDLKALLETNAGEKSPDIQYTRALIAFSQSTDVADRIAQKAWHTNKHVPAILSGKMRPVPMGPFITMGGENEASGYVATFGKAWKRTPGAIAWLSKVAASEQKFFEELRKSLQQ